MTELPIDQSNLPRVQEVRRDFSVLEDGALAHCLQEQEIEQHYASNVQKNKLVQKDIRIAKKLQGEEDERNRLRSLEKQRQIEERDSEYARVIQEELRRKAEKCRQREEEDKEIAKRLQELEREEVRRWSEESPTRSEELERSGSRHRLQRRRSKQDDEYSIYQNPNDKSPITGDTSRSQWTPEPDRVRHSSKERTSDLSLASDSTYILDGSEERHSNSHRITNREAWVDRNNEQDQLVHRERTNSWDPPERTLGQDSVVGEHVLRHGRSRSLREQGQVFGEPFSKYHHEGRRYSNSKSEGRHELDVLEGHPRSDWSRGKPHHTQLSTTKESSPRNRSQGLRSGDVVVLPNHVEVLEWQMSDLELQSREQLLRDEELARRLQEEEEKQLTTGRPPAPIEDFRAAQVAQDEEIAKYIQRQELKSRLRSESVNRRESIDDSRSSISSTERRQSTDQMSEGNVSHQIRLDSDGFPSPRENTLPQRSPLFLCRERRDSEKQLAPKNIAEELDPTFKSKRKESQEDVFSACSQECPTPSPPHVVPVDGFYDFMDDGADPAFVQPTRRQSEKLGRQKSSNKKENCKQQ